MPTTLPSAVMAGLERVREVRERLLAGGDVLPVAVGPMEGSALRDWVRREGARRTIETGLGYAISTLFICEGLLANGSGGRHVAIDPNRLESLDTLEDAGVRGLVEFHAEESQTALPRLLSEGRRFDLAFIDGNHRFEGVTQLPAIARAVSFCVSNLGWMIKDEGREDEHERVVLRTGPPEAFPRPFESFVEF